MNERRVAIFTTISATAIASLGLIAQLLSMLLFGRTEGDITSTIYLIAMMGYFLACCFSMWLVRRKAKAGVVLSAIAGILCTLIMTVTYWHFSPEDGYPSILILLCVGVIAPGLVVGTFGIIGYTLVSLAICLWAGVVFNDFTQAVIAVTAGVWSAFVSWLLRSMLNEQQVLLEGHVMFCKLLLLETGQDDGNDD